MKMEVLTVQSNYELGSNKVRDWTSTLTPPTPAAVAPKKVSIAAAVATKSSNTRSSSSNTHSIKHKQQQASSSSSSNNKKTKSNSSYHYQQQISSYEAEQQCRESDMDAAEVAELSLRLLDKLREAKSRHLTCTEVSLPCDLTTKISADIIRVSEKEPCGLRGCTIYVEFEDEPQNSRRIASLKLDPETVSTFEVYLTLRQDHRGWTALLPQFMKSLARTITISPEYSITKLKLYAADGLSARRSYSFGSSSSHSHSQAIATPTI